MHEPFGARTTSAWSCNAACWARADAKLFSRSSHRRARVFFSLSSAATMASAARARSRMSCVLPSSRCLRGRVGSRLGVRLAGGGQQTNHARVLCAPHSLVCNGIGQLLALLVSLPHQHLPRAQDLLARLGHVFKDGTPVVAGGARRGMCVSAEQSNTARGDARVDTHSSLSSCSRSCSDASVSVSCFSLDCSSTSRCEMECSPSLKPCISP